MAEDLEPHFDDADFRRGAINILEDVFKRLQELEEQEYSVLKVQFIGIVEGAKVRSLEEDDDEMYVDGVLYFFKQICDECEEYPDKMGVEDYETLLAWLRGEHSDIVVADL